ncbi:rod shape-determining protein MreC [Telmatospirillum sp.]|uniref:rod shape-determining protein MreC n=1 Tax=Telmatospirillum sp. TaxID=2079197 RepID=UPI002850F600|nr:rod shape-determining protein MreC [Telmatospirillum sp.]MDR3437661.1 rod shape-determining protein MreC [Telmatospirillum sp.]
MKQHSGALGRLATLRQLAQRFAFLALAMASFGLMLLGKADTVLVERMRVAVSDAVVPILDVMSRPAGTIADVVGAVRELATLRAENVRLREENANLMHWQTLARQLDNENRALKNQLNYLPDPDPSFITTRVVGDTGGAFVHSMLVNSGSRDGIRKGQAVIAGEFLVGRVAEVGQRSARVLLITDINSHIPVLLENSRAKAILTGDNTDRPRLSYLSSGTNAAPGDRVVSSGHGGAFPPGLPIGVISSVQDGIVRVEPFVHRYQLEYVTVVDYGLPGILPSDPVPEGRER